jgi:predicted lipoprotein
VRARIGAALVVLAVLAPLTACSDDAPPTRPATLARMADTAIVPRYADFERAAGELVTAAQTLCAQRDEPSLEAARAALAKARRAWKTVEAMWVGPVMERRSASLVDSPINEDDIEELASATTPATIDADYIGTRAGSDERGLRGVEHLLGSPDVGAPVLEDARRCAYAVAVADVISTEAAALQGDWTRSFDGGPSYRDRLADPANTADLDIIVNDVFFLLQEITVKELGPGLGLFGPADLDAVVEGAAGLGVADLQARMTGIRLVLIGDGDKSKGLGPLLGAEMTGRLRAQLDAADADMAAIHRPLRIALGTDTDAVQRVRASINAVQVIVATEVLSTLGVKVGFSGADGDSGA